MRNVSLTALVGFSMVVIGQVLMAQPPPLANKVCPPPPYGSFCPGTALIPCGPMGAFVACQINAGICANNGLPYKSLKQLGQVIGNTCTTAVVTCPINFNTCSTIYYDDACCAATQCSVANNITYCL